VLRKSAVLRGVSRVFGWAAVARGTSLLGLNELANGDARRRAGDEKRASPKAGPRDNSRQFEAELRTGT
jgi:hypothetical protein